MTLEEQFFRLIKTLQLIEREPGEWDAAALEVEFNVGHATVERDIRILRQWGTIERKKGCFVVKDMKFMPRNFTSSETLALVLAGSMIASRIEMPPSDSLRSAMKKIDSVLPEQVDTMIRRMQKRFSIGVDLVRECNSEILNSISKAVSSHRTVEISYYVPGRNEITRRKVDPYGLTFRFGTWYVIGYCHLRDGVRTFAVDRVKSLKTTQKRFVYPGDFHLEEYLERGWRLQANAEPEHIVLRFSPAIAPLIMECKFHPHQKLTLQDDGAALFEVTVAGVDEIKHWVLGYGDKVEVIGPQSLRDSVAATARNMAAVYS